MTQLYRITDLRTGAWGYSERSFMPLAMRFAANPDGEALVGHLQITPCGTTEAWEQFQDAMNDGYGGTFDEWCAARVDDVAA